MNLIRPYILIELLEEPLFPSQIVSKLDEYDNKDVYNNLRHLIDSKLITKSASGIYSITESGKENIQSLISKAVRVMQF